MSHGFKERRWLSVCPGANGRIRRCWSDSTLLRPTRTFSADKYILGHNWRSRINLWKENYFGWRNYMKKCRITCGNFCFVFSQKSKRSLIRTNVNGISRCWYFCRDVLGVRTAWWIRVGIWSPPSKVQCISLGQGCPCHCMSLGEHLWFQPAFLK